MSAEPEGEPSGEPFGGITNQINRGWATVLHMWVLQLGCLFLWNLLYHAFFNVQAELCNPFGKRRIDMPHETCMYEIRQLAMRLMEDARNCVPHDSSLHKHIVVVGKRRSSRESVDAVSGMPGGAEGADSANLSTSAMASATIAGSILG